MLSSRSRSDAVVSFDGASSTDWVNAATGTGRVCQMTGTDMIFPLYPLIHQVSLAFNFWRKRKLDGESPSPPVCSH